MAQWLRVIGVSALLTHLNDEARDIRTYADLTAGVKSAAGYESEGAEMDDTAGVSVRNVWQGVVLSGIGFLGTGAGALTGGATWQWLAFAVASFALGFGLGVAVMVKK